MNQASVLSEKISGTGVFLPYHTQPDWLPRDMADAIVEYAIENESMFQAGRILQHGKLVIDESIRQVSTLTHMGPFQTALKDAAMASKPMLETLFGMPAFSASQVEIEMAAHGDGAHFQRHVDTFVVGHNRPNPRVLTLVLYLHRQPCGFTGGALRFHALGGTTTRDIAPEHNLLTAFPSSAPHSVQRLASPGGAFADRRFAVNMWIRR